MKLIMKCSIFSVALLIVVLAIQNTNVKAEHYMMTDMEWNVDRYGSDYKPVDLLTSDPTLCEDECAKDPKCIAWTYVKPNTVQGPRPRCWLKDGVPPPRPSSHCVSGIKIRLGAGGP
jgi:hypothetical protein